MDRTYCNPIPLPDYPRGRFSIPDDITHGWLNGGQRHDFRETADPSVLYHDGKCYLYPSCGMAWVSEDFVSWKHEPMNVYDIGYAPTIMAHEDAFYLTASDAPLYRADSPLGPWEEVGMFACPDGSRLPIYADLMCFSDDDGRVYLYWGLGSPGIFGVELDGHQLNRAITEPKVLFAYDPDHTWERCGPFNEDPANSFVEGPWMLKHKGIYYLTYTGPGTSFQTYAMGVYTSMAPLGPFEYAERNPFLLKTSGLVRGSGHGCIVQGPRDTLWTFYTMTVCYHHIFERRIGFDPVGVDDDGNLYASATETPQLAPGIADQPELCNDAGLLPVSVSKFASASSQAPGRAPLYATDNYMCSWWQAADDDENPWLEVDLRSEFTISSLRLMWAEPNLDYNNGVVPGPYRYQVETRHGEDPWQVTVDRSDNDEDMLIEYITFPSCKATHARLIVSDWPTGMQVAVVDFSLFGSGSYPPPGKYGVWPPVDE